jgi:hypothetical protein
MLVQFYATRESPVMQFDREVNTSLQGRELQVA